MIERLSSGTRRARRSLRVALTLLAVLALVLALAELKLGYTWEEMQRRGVDIVVAVDVSDSMLVEDAESAGALSRLEQQWAWEILLTRLRNLRPAQGKNDYRHISGMWVRALKHLHVKFDLP